MEDSEWYDLGKNFEPVKRSQNSIRMYLPDNPPIEFKPMEIIRKLEALEKRIAELEADRKRCQD